MILTHMPGFHEAPVELVSAESRLRISPPSLRRGSYFRKLRSPECIFWISPAESAVLSVRPNSHPHASLLRRLSPWRVRCFSNKRARAFGISVHETLALSPIPSGRDLLCRALLRFPCRVSYFFHLFFRDPTGRRQIPISDEMRLILVVKMSAASVLRSYCSDGINQRPKFGSTLSTVRDAQTVSTTLPNAFPLINLWNFN